MQPQHTLSLWERAQSAALTAVADAWAAEGTARSRVATHLERTAGAIHNARLAGITWPEICAQLDGMGRQAAYERLRNAGYPTTSPHRPGRDDADTTALHRLSLAWATECSARDQVAAAKQDVAAAAAVARQMGATWAQLREPLGGMTRAPLLARLTEWAHSPTLAVPAAAQPGGPVELAAVVGASWPQQAVRWWQSPGVRKAVSAGVRAAAGMVRATALDQGHSPVTVLQRSDTAARRAVEAAAEVVVDTAGHSPGLDVREVAARAESAAAATGTR